MGLALATSTPRTLCSPEGRARTCVAPLGQSELLPKMKLSRQKLLESAIRCETRELAHQNEINFSLRLIPGNRSGEPEELRHGNEGPVGERRRVAQKQHRHVARFDGRCLFGPFPLLRRTRRLHHFSRDLACLFEAARINQRPSWDLAMILVTRPSRSFPGLRRFASDAFRCLSGGIARGRGDVRAVNCLLAEAKQGRPIPNASAHL
mmetsp:Transcript_13826/g.51594  ORF Transcript_13826/g.51594 Transcript_13826/m.51594 type:complete len:207 (+) Transcript_13826:678-1298(+)